MTEDKAKIRELKRELIDKQREIGKIAMKHFKQAEELERQKLEIDILIRKKEALRDEIAEKDAEIEKLREQINKGDKIYEEAMLNAEAEKNNLKQVIETFKNNKIIIQLDDEVLLKDFKTEVNKEINTIKSEAYREFAERVKKSIRKSVDDAWHSDGIGIYDAEYVLDDIDNLLKELTESNE